MNAVPRHFKGRVWRSDFPDDPPGTVDEANVRGWTPEHLVYLLVRRHGPTTQIEVDCDGVLRRFDGKREALP